ncbi:hypothetical protein BU15DRAFT_52979 [Melanogaster broomeanus]|nr:hypothetical protein BU15DRAFT_52979 [Melanogaster broomeanus]
MFHHGVSTSGCQESVPGPPTIARTHTVDILRLILSSDNVSSDHPHVYSPNAIRSLYYSAESRNQLGKLDSNMLSVLIGLFGSLSIDPQTSLVYRVPLASHLVGESAGRPRSHWAFVQKVGKYKQRNGMTLQDSDRFWLMRAELATVGRLNVSFAAIPDKVVSAIMRARIHYHIIRRHSFHPDVHAPYFEMLLDTQDPQYLNLAAGDIAFALRTHPVCHPRLLHMLYRLVVQHGAVLCAASQRAILSALWKRACRTDMKSGLPSDNRQTEEGSDNYLEHLDATALAQALSTTLLGCPYSILSGKHTKTTNLLFSVFSPAVALPRRWTALTLLSLFNTSAIVYSNELPSPLKDPMPLAASCWQVIFGLATVEKVLQGSLPALGTPSVSTQSVLVIVHSLYQTWLPIMEARLVPREIACSISASFSRLASVVPHVSLLDACRALSNLRVGFDGPQTLADNSMIAHYITATVRVQGVLPDTVFRLLDGFSQDLQRQRQVIAIAVEALTAVDPPLAHALYTTAHAAQKEPGSKVIHTLALSLARVGALDLAVRYLSDYRFSLDQRGTLIAAIARRIREDRRTRYPTSVFASLADELLVLYQFHHPPEHFRGYLEQLLVDLCQNGKTTRAIRVVSFIAQRPPDYFQPRFYMRLCLVVLRHRQFAAAARLIATITATSPKVARSLRLLVERTAIRARTSRAVDRIRIQSTSSFSDSLTRMLGRSGSRSKPLRGPMSLKLSSFLRRSSCVGPWLERVMQELLDSRRLLAAKSLFARVAPVILSKRCTALGNIILHGVSRQPTPRNGRRVRRFLALLAELIKNHGFQPDRVTVNIMIKVMTSWQSMFDSRRLRALFDQLVRGGCPAGEYSPQHPPFGTPPVQSSNPLGLSMSKLPSYISFERHSRPLFKMFIKAFYLGNDKQAARKVVGILKAEEHRHTNAKQARRKARSEGRIKALRLGRHMGMTVVPPK